MPQLAEVERFYTENGFVVLRSLFEADELFEIDEVLNAFHQNWLNENREFYLQQAINSAYITSSNSLDSQQRMVLFHFICQAKIQRPVRSILGGDYRFMNSQLFFDPHNSAQNNYWHRDPQYHMSLDEQRAALTGPQVLHCRIALKDEPGIELIPGSHNKWDSDEELAVRLELNGRKNYQSLDRAKQIALQAGDVLLFDANMIHRGLYGQDRFAWDLLFCQNDPGLLSFVREDILPSSSERQRLALPEIFQTN